MMRLSQTMGDDEIYTVGPHDPFAQAIGREEHPGRMRLTGFDIISSLLRTRQQESKVDILERRVDELTQRMNLMSSQRSSEDVMLARASHQDSAPTAFSADIRNDLNDPQPQDFDDNSTKVYLYLFNPLRYVVMGNLIKGTGSKIHCRDVTPDYKRVSVKFFMAKEADTPIPKSVMDCQALGGSVGFVIEWPEKLISNTLKDICAPQKGKQTMRLKAIEPRIPERTTETIGCVHICLLGYSMPDDVPHEYALQYRLEMLARPNKFGLLEIPINAHFQNSGWIDRIDASDVLDVVFDRWIGASSIILYLRYLGELYLSRYLEVGARYSFISPHLTPESTVHGNDWKTIVIQYMLSFEGREHLTFMPVNVGKHWVLVAINVRTENVFYMDSFHYSIDHRDHLKIFVENVMLSYRSLRRNNTLSRSFSKITFRNVKLDGWRCGRIVCCYIEDIINSQRTTIPSNFVLSPEIDSYSTDKMDRFKLDWTGYLYNRFLK